MAGTPELSPAPAAQRINDTQTHLADLISQIDRALTDLGLLHRLPTRLYEPMHYVMGLKAKRMRPMLALLAYEAYAPGPVDRCLPVALAIELFHNFTLVHDDIMDRAPTRRGMPTVHMRWDASTAILSGDALFALAMQQLARTRGADVALLTEIFSQTALEVCEGQMRDMDLAEQPHAHVDEYLNMIRQKTAVLLGASLQMGALTAGAPAAEAQNLYELGVEMGMGFQLQDDLLDVFAPASSGKQPGGDIVENKKTYLWLRAYELASPEQTAELDRLGALADQPDEKVRQVTALYNQLGIAAETQQRVAHYFQQADARLAALRMHHPALATLAALSDQLRHRQT